MSLRTKIIQQLIGLNERIFFYPRLKKFYVSALKGKNISVIDVGVNKGQSVDFFKRIDKNAVIFGFEPNKKLFKVLIEKYSADRNLHFYNSGVSNCTGELEFYENVMDETSSFEKLNYDSEYLHKKARVLGVSKENIITAAYKVNVITLADFLGEKKDMFFDVLKVDVEGHELSVLEGLFKEKKAYPVRFIQLESHNDNMYLNSNNKNLIESILQQNGFVLLTKIKHGFGDFFDVIYENQHFK